jgi:hypothetical protein
MPARSWLYVIAPTPFVLTVDPPALQVRVRIIRQPLGAVDDIALSSYRVGRVYDLPVSLGHYLIAENLAICEMRRDDPPPFTRYPGDRRGKSID